MDNSLTNLRQKTLKDVAQIQGIGLHSGDTVTLTIYPAPADHGIVFRRIDIAGKPKIAALAENVSPTPLCTTLENDAGIQVKTIEHLMAAFSACRIYNALIDIDGCEVPILDGSSVQFLNAIHDAGIQILSALQPMIKVLGAVTINDQDKQASLKPNDTFAITMAIDFEDAAIGQQKGIYKMSLDAFTAQLASARTFCMHKDVEAMQKVGLAKGGSLDNAIVVDNGQVLNPEGLRFDDEFVRHKALDAVGDLALLGMPVIADYHGTKASHFLNYRLVIQLLQTESAWEIQNTESAQHLYQPHAQHKSNTADAPILN